VRRSTKAEIKAAKEEKISSADLREAHYRTHEDHLKAKTEQIDAEFNLSMAWNALKAFDDRKDSLENEVKLWRGRYFSTPREERMAESGKKILDIINRKDEGSQNIREEMNTRRRRTENNK